MQSLCKLISYSKQKYYSIKKYYSLQMLVKYPTSGGQTRDEDAAVQWTLHLERSSFFYLSVLMVRT